MGFSLKKAFSQVFDGYGSNAWLGVGDVFGG